MTKKEWPESQVENKENVLSWKSKEECSLSKDGDYHLYKMLIKVNKMWTGKGPLYLTTVGSLIKAVLIENAFFYSMNTEAGWLKNGELVENGIRSEGTERSFSDFTVKGEQKKLEQLLKFGKLNSGHRTGKGQFSFQSQRKAMPKNAQTTTQLHSSHTLVK